MTISEVINEIALLDAKVVSIPRRFPGTSNEEPSCYFNVDAVDSKGAAARFRVECDDSIAESALNAVEKGSVGDFYGTIDGAYPHTVTATFITLTA